MPYCTQTDILLLELTEKELIELTDDLNVGPVNAAQVTAAIAKADSEIDAYCQAQYTVPFGPASEVLGTDGKNYTCIVAHTAAAINKPVTGANYATYWAQKGSAGGTWVDGSAYTAVPNIVTAWSATLAAFNLFRNRTKPATLLDRYNKVMSWLSAILKGERTIPGMTDESSLPASTTQNAAPTFARHATAPASVVLGTDGKTYTCIAAHTAAAANQPITGADWASYWIEQGMNGGTWTAGAAYVPEGYLTVRAGTMDVW
jgi:phage gp36-like protein